MLYHVRMDVHPPRDLDPAAFEKLKSEEKARALELQRQGKWLHLWRITGQYANHSVFDVSDHDELHVILSTLPLFPFMKVSVTAISQHPSSLTQQQSRAE